MITVIGLLVAALVIIGINQAIATLKKYPTALCGTCGSYTWADEQCVACLSDPVA